MHNPNFFCRNHCFNGTFVIDPPAPDATTTLTIKPAVLPANGTATVTIAPKNSGSALAASATNFTLTVTAGGGNFSAITPASGTNLTATFTAGTNAGSFTAGTNAGSFTISNGIATAPAASVSVIKAVPLSSISLNYAASAATAQLAAQSLSNLPLRVLATSDFLVWSNLGPATSSAAGLLQFADTNAPAAQRFYRLAYP